MRLTDLCFQTKNIMGGGSAGQRANAMASQGKQHRFNQMKEYQKLKREDMLMKRRGLNFVTEHHEELLQQDVIEACETQLDNVAPKIVAILALSETSDTEAVRNALVRSCLVYQESQKSKKQEKKDEEELMEEEEAFGTQFKAYLCPNPSSSTNMSSRKQRLVFLQIDRNDPYSVMDVCKVADLVVTVMSCKHTNI